MIKKYTKARPEPRKDTRPNGKSRNGKSPTGPKAASGTTRTQGGTRDPFRRITPSPREKNTLEPCFLKAKRTPEIINPAPGGSKSPEVIELEDGEIPPVVEVNPEPNDMGGKASVPRVLRRVADAIEVEEGEIRDGSPLPEEVPLPRDSGTGSTSDVSHVTPRTWKKNDGKGVKGRARRLLPTPSRSSGIPDTEQSPDGDFSPPEARRQLAADFQRLSSRPTIRDIRGGPPSEPARRREMTRHRLPPFKDRRIVSLPDLEELRYRGCRTYEWRKRGGSLGREGRITPRDFRQRIVPKKRELRQDGVVSQREGRIMQERRKRSRDSGETKRRQLPRRGSPFPVVDLTEDEDEGRPTVADRRRALDALEAVGARYQELLEKFAHDYGSEDDERSQGRKKKPRVLSIPGEVSRDETGVRRPGFPVVAPRSPCYVPRPVVPPTRGGLDPLVIDEDNDAVQVRRSGSVAQGGGGPQAPQSPPPVPSPTEGSLLPPPRMRSPPVPLPEPRPRPMLGPMPARQPPPPQRPPGPTPRPDGPPPRALRPRVRAPPPGEPRGRGGMPGTGSRATQKRRLRRERAELFAAAAAAAARFDGSSPPPLDG